MTLKSSPAAEGSKTELEKRSCPVEQAAINLFVMVLNLLVRCSESHSNAESALWRRDIFLERLCGSSLLRDCTSEQNRSARGRACSKQALLRALIGLESSTMGLLPWL